MNVRQPTIGHDFGAAVRASPLNRCARVVLLLMCTLAAVPGAAQLSAPPANDHCTSAAPMAFTVRADTRAASTTQLDPFPPCGRGRAFKSVWYRLTPIRDTPIVLTTFGSTYDTIVSVYTGTCNALTPVACNDDAFESGKNVSSTMRQSQVSFSGAGGRTYWVMVSAYHNDGGELVLNLMGAQGMGAQGPLLLEACALDPHPIRHPRQWLLPWALGLLAILVRTHRAVLQAVARRQDVSEPTPSSLAAGGGGAKEGTDAPGQTPL